MVYVRADKMSTYSYFYCKERLPGFQATIQHLTESHDQQDLRFRKYDGQQIKTINCKIVPDLCREQGRSTTLNEARESIHVSRACAMPKDSPFKKLIKVENNTSGTTPGSTSDNNCSMPNTVYCEDLSGCSDYIQESDSGYEELLALLSKVIDTLNLGSF